MSVLEKMSTVIKLDIPVAGYDVNKLLISKTNEKIQTALYSPSTDKEGKLLLMRSDKKIILPAETTAKPKLNCKLIFDKYLSREGKSTGAILSGLHGDGKTLTCELLATEMLAISRPVIIINTYVSHLDLMKIVSITDGCLILFDEFDRYYSPAQQSEMVGFFSDSGLSNVLILVTTNNYGRIQTVLKNRPGRFLFHVRHNGLGMDMFELLSKDFEYTESFREDMEYYIESIKPSFDVMRVIVDIAMVSDNDLETFITIMKDYNTPAWPGLTVESKSTFAKIPNRGRRRGKGIEVYLEGNYPDYQEATITVKPPRKPGLVTVDNPFYDYMTNNAPRDYSLPPDRREEAAKNAKKNVPKDLVLEFVAADNFNHMTENPDRGEVNMPAGYIPQE